MTTIKLTSPNMKGPGIKVLQKALAGDNPFNVNFKPGRTDGVYGPSTASSVKRAKFWLGFPPKLINTVAGESFQKYLYGTKNLPRSYRLRAKLRRKNSQKKKLMRDKAYDLAVSKIGVKESPAGSNRVLFSDWYNMIGPWCAMFVTWCYVGAGSKQFIRSQRYAYCPYIVSDAIGNRYGLSVTSSPEKGDLVLFDWQGDNVSDHIGIFEGWKGKSKSVFTSIEGNTSLTNDSNGGEVMRRERNVSQVQVFVRVSE